MKSQTKKKCVNYLGWNKCGIVAKGECRCCGEKCWFIKAKLNTPEKFEMIKKLNVLMKKDISE